MATMGGGGGWDQEGDLVRRGFITQEDLDEARERSRDPVQWLYNRERITEKGYYTYRAMRAGMAFADLDRIPFPFEAAHVLSLDDALELGALPIKKDGNTLWVVLIEFNDKRAVEAIASRTGFRVIPVTAAPSKLRALLDRFRELPSFWPTDPPSRDPGEMLVFRESITAERLAEAQEASDDPVRWLLDQGTIGEHEFAMARAFEHGIFYGEHPNEPIRNMEPDLFPQETARRFRILPLRWKGEKLLVAVSDPRDWESIRLAEKATGMKIEPIRVIRKRDLDEALALD